MIESFEARLAELLAERLTTPAGVTVVRPQDGLATLAAGKARVTVQVLDGHPSAAIGDDSQEVLARDDGFALRPLLRLDGVVRLTVEVASGSATQRTALLAVVDRVLLALHDGAVRDGSAFETDTDLGFALDGFRLDQAIPPELTTPTVPPPPPDFHKLVLVYRYTGRFWPVGVEASGGVIRSLPTRFAVLPFPLPGDLAVRAGSADLTIPVRAALGASAGAQPRLVAKLLGAAPPGQLVGDSTGLPEGTGYLPDAGGAFQVVYRPPASVAGRASVRIALELASADRPTLALGELAVEVRA